MLFHPHAVWALAAIVVSLDARETGSLADIDHVILFMQGVIPLSHLTIFISSKPNREPGLRSLLWDNGWSPRVCRPQYPGQ
jgi:hypothetical protein